MARGLFRYAAKCGREYVTSEDVVAARAAGVKADTVRRWLLEALAVRAVEDVKGAAWVSL